ncbi:hypothetical protein B0H15DRAFT_511581 [Mycena belliarum]|uniref:Uncharacterized protein n=1 Tax=Mycena belliarum TaxID=1033014 RepID=A0AAD6XW53_9AGAR|nr:hypothetical protein B0H15DRAFT_511581 [Mycena belliae]
MVNTMIQCSLFGPACGEPLPTTIFEVEQRATGPGKLHQRIVPENPQIGPLKANILRESGPKKANVGQGLSREPCRDAARYPRAPKFLQNPLKIPSESHSADKAGQFWSSKSHHSDKEIANFRPQKAKFPDNPLVELPGASRYIPWARGDRCSPSCRMGGCLYRRHANNMAMHICAT